MTLTKDETRIIEQYRALSKADKLEFDKLLSQINSKRDFYTINEAAEQIGVTYRTCIEYIRTNKLSAHKVGGKWAIDKDALNTFIRG